MKVIGKYSRIGEVDALEETYHIMRESDAENSLSATKGIQMVLDEMSSRNPKAKALQPAAFIDVRQLQDLEQRGFIKNLYKN